MSISKQRGVGLIELMIASVIGIVALMAIGSLYINVQKVAAERYKQLTLIQNTASVVQMFSSDLQRAGYDGNNGYSLRISGATDTLYTLNGVDHGLVAYAYQVGTSGALPLYKNVVYQQRSGASNSLFVCEKKRTTIMDVHEVVNLAGTRLCFNLFDSKVIELSDFEVKSERVEGPKARTALVDIEVVTHLTDQPSIESRQALTIKQRNWQ
ncbi:PilW family protein [Vibrio astriarenae]